MDWIAIHALADPGAEAVSAAPPSRILPAMAAWIFHWFFLGFRRSAGASYPSRKPAVPAELNARKKNAGGFSTQPHATRNSVAVPARISSGRFHPFRLDNWKWIPYR
jgi:hypothetical protein